MLHYIEAIGTSFERQALSYRTQHPDAICQQRIYTHQPQAQLKPLHPIKNVIAVASGKGGVGKSTIAFNLAHTLASAQLNVALLDADIYGPSLPILSGITDKALVRPDKKFEPHYAYKMSLLSIGHLVDPETALIWRGPMACGALMQLFSQTAWPPIDIMIIDLPPGTGDLILTLCQKIPLVGVLMVAVNHPLALADVKRSEAMFERLMIPSLGTVMNYDIETKISTFNNTSDTLISLAHTQSLFDSTAHAQPLSLYAPQALEVKAFQFLAEALIDRLAMRPLASLIPMSMKSNES
jgi:Mrp family chromosome partitioning ATPase